MSPPTTRKAPAGAETAAPPVAEPRTLRGLVRYFLKLGGLGFGGPIALVGYMQRDLVERRRWFTEDEFRQALAVGQTMPGPLAAQVAMWFGYLHAGARGAVAVAAPFVVPPFVVVTAVAVLYAKSAAAPRPRIATRSSPPARPPAPVRGTVPRTGTHQHDPPAPHASASPRPSPYPASRP
jgi:hypothetical protein